MANLDQKYDVHKAFDIDDDSSNGAHRTFRALVLSRRSDCPAKVLTLVVHDVRILAVGIIYHFNRIVVEHIRCQRQTI